MKNEPLCRTLNSKTIIPWVGFEPTKDGGCKLTYSLTDHKRSGEWIRDQHSDLFTEDGQLKENVNPKEKVLKLISKVTKEIEDELGIRIQLLLYGQTIVINALYKNEAGVKAIYNSAVKSWMSY